jgi:hypothetical protein
MIHRGVIVRIVEERIIEWIVGVEVRVVVVAPIGSAEKQADRDPRRSEIGVTAGKTITPRIIVDRPVVRGGVVRCVGHALDHFIAKQIVVKVPLCHTADQLVELSLGVAGQARRSECAVVPVVIEDEALKAEGIP